jgi:hypothetical protein
METTGLPMIANYYKTKGTTDVDKLELIWWYQLLPAKCFSVIYI